MRTLRELAIRAAVAVVLVPPLAVVIGYGGVGFAATLAAAAAIGAREYYRLTLPGPWRRGAIGVVAAAAWPLVAWRTGTGAVAVVVIASMAAWVEQLARGPRPTVTAEVGHVVAGVLFSTGGLVALGGLRGQDHGAAWVAAVLIATWANDAAAFLVGKAIGRHRLWPAVSPGKTWEGAVAGAVGGTAAVLGVRPWLPAIGLGDALVIAAIASTLGPIGDLCKSLLKRTHHVKDTGRIFLAHGGMLDRIDALLFNAPAVLGYVLLVR